MRRVGRPRRSSDDSMLIRTSPCIIGQARCTLGKMQELMPCSKLIEAGYQLSLHRCMRRFELAIEEQ